jgi:hypothetical protein
VRCVQEPRFQLIIAYYFFVSKRLIDISWPAFGCR